MEHIAIFHAQLEHLPVMLHWVRERLEPLPLRSSEKNKFEIAAEEILVNIICYAYKENKGNIEMHWEESPPFIHLTFKDFGMPFNPLDYNKVSVTNVPIEQKDIGGLGIFFIKNFADKMEYQYDRGANILTISKNID